MKYNAGMLKQRVILQTATNTAEAGDYTETWSDTATRWAAVRQLSGAEAAAAQQTQSGRVVEVVIRYLDGVAAQQRWKYGTRYLYITSVDNVNEADRWTVCWCEERNVTA